MTQRAIKHLAKRVLPESLVRSAKRLKTGQAESNSAGLEPASKSADATDALSHEVALLEDRLWGGYETASRTRLGEIAVAEHVDSSIKVHASLALARWLANRADFEAALTHLDLSGSESGPLELEIVSLYVDCLCHLGRAQEALSRLAPLVHRQAVDPSTLLRLGCTRSLADGGTGHGSGHLIEALNRLYARRHFVQLRRRDVSQPASMGNLAAVPPSYEPSESSFLISVIVPIAGTTHAVRTAIASVCAQSWPELEILVVGAISDLGPSDTEQLAELDSRIRLIDSAGPGGESHSRNVGVTEANGEYIAVHGADEWSHPQRIELLATALASDPSLRATGTFFAEVGEDRIHRATDPRSISSVIGRNVSSLMVRRIVFDELGGWDEVPIRTDEEFIARIETRFGPESVEWLEPEVPMSVVTGAPSDPSRPLLAGTAPTYHALDPRSRYREAFQWWHSSPDFLADVPFWPGRSPHRPFAAPLLGDPENPPQSLEFDIVIVGDLESGERLNADLVDAIEKHSGEVGIIQIPSFDSPLRKSPAMIHSLAASGSAAMLGRGAPIRCRSVILSPSILTSPPFDGLPQVVTESAYAIAPSREPGAGSAANCHAALEAWLDVPITTVDYIDETVFGARTWR